MVLEVEPKIARRSHLGKFTYVAQTHSPRTLHKRSPGHEYRGRRSSSHRVGWSSIENPEGRGGREWRLLKESNHLGGARTGEIPVSVTVGSSGRRFLNLEVLHRVHRNPFRQRSPPNVHPPEITQPHIPPQAPVPNPTSITKSSSAHPDRDQIGLGCTGISLALPGDFAQQTSFIVMIHLSLPRDLGSSAPAVLSFLFISSLMSSPGMKSG